MTRPAFIMSRSFCLSLILLLVSSFFVFFLTPHADAVSSNCAVVKVGNAPGNPVLPPGCTVPAGPTKKFVYFCQNDYTYCDINISGCGVASTAMILNTFGIKKTPQQVADTFYQLGYRKPCINGSNIPAVLNGYLAAQGFTHVLLLQNRSVGDHAVCRARSGLPNLDLIKKNYIDHGYLIIASIEGHIFVIDQIDPNHACGTTGTRSKCESHPSNVCPIHMQDPAGPGCSTRAQGGYWTNNQYPWLGVYSLWYAYAVKKVK